MVPGELTGLHYLAPENQILVPANIGMMQNTIPGFHFNRLLNNLPNFHIQPPAHEFTAQSSSFSNNSTSDEAEEHQVSIIDERKRRRMISNRESARRSRMRKQKHLDELWSQVIRLRNENQSLIDKLNHVSECHDLVLQENARLKEETSDLRQVLTDIKIDSPYSLALKELEEVPCNTAHLRAESTNQSIANSVDFLHRDESYLAI
ncbi:Basic leucine zipper 43 [Hibiscus syriacus]|uniref:Basic leucine zipper 43 n=1 Tax=Hibiscus syriacus TaxID=106335 RepID=A0A6A3BV87_HIBSY|nr:basic leucine zipper 43-like [Hibiscus syriacus]KAE8719811.1 Basic leucine zipper 43 [Hibiscus syriacus]